MLVVLTCLVLPVAEPTAEVKATIARVLLATGGAEQRPTLFRLKERLRLGDDPDKPGNQRTSVMEPPKYWWLNKKERVREEKEPAVFLVWAWTLGALTDAESKVEATADLDENGQSAFGLRVSESITPPLDLYFSKTDARLLRIDWRSDIHRFSEWKTVEGWSYPSRCVGYKKSTSKIWYATDILEIEKLTELPAGLMR